jgi:cytochrome P450 family 142 subfamily A polypeptide 1
LFIAGGAETTRTVISHGIRVLADHPDSWERMAAEPEVVTTAVEELIRWVTPLNNFFRTALEDTTIGGRPVAEGDRVVLLYPSANRDEDVFVHPSTFDIGRSPNPHVAFGHGTHFCLGANLARRELQALFRELPRRFEPPVVVTEPDVEPNIFARAVRSFRVELTPRPEADRRPVDAAPGGAG